MSVRRLAASLRMHRTTALRWPHRFLQRPVKIKDLALRGVVEADVACMLELFKGQRRGGKARKRGLWREQIPILVLRARTGQTADFVLPAAPDKAALNNHRLKPVGL